MCGECDYLDVNPAMARKELEYYRSRSGNEPRVLEQDETMAVLIPVYFNNEQAAGFASGLIKTDHCMIKHLESLLNNDAEH